MIRKNKRKTLINKEVYKMKNEFLTTLRYFFETHANPLPPCGVDGEDIDADVRPKRGYVSFEDPDDKKALTYVYADCFENVVAKGYPLESVIKVLKDHGILTYVGRLADYYGIEGKVYEIQEHVLEGKLKIFTADEMLRKLMLITMLARRKLENALSRMGQLSPRQLEEENAMGKIRWSIGEAQSMAGGVNELFSKAKKLLQILEDL
ncbi:MAG: hypothetical protein LBT63_02200 [Holosporaceae bacterium]|jgi:gamma-glutamylcyclotransferase (GGCT)/AIG2-like uncharacterized protein YtfP|nr:hypothetical protein [Holosporaceae bacterium]